MAKASPIISSFNAGEFSPLLLGRTDVKYYQNGCRRCRNFLVSKQGPARRRPGNRFVAEVKTSANRTWLWRFEFNVQQAYVLEFGNLYIRFYASHGVVGAPFEVVTPYTTADLQHSDGSFALRFVQSGDVLYICHPNYAPRKLTRTGPATFAISVMTNLGGPFKDLDLTNTTTVYASAASGAGITLTASAAIFLATHIGALFYMEQKNVDTIPMWESGKVVGAGARRRSDGKNYVTAAGGTTGTVKPTHSVGSKYDGDAGAQWTFEDPGYGYARITAIGGGGTTATADVVSNFPFLAVLVANATTRWAFGSWSDAEGWPDNVTFFRERLCFSRNRNVWQSVAGDFESFASKDTSGTVTAEQAISSDVTSDRANQIQWLAPFDIALVIGTMGDESGMSEISTTEAFGPGNVRNRKQSEYGSRHAAPARVGEGLLFIHRSGRKVRDLIYSWEKDGFIANDTTVLAEHITKGGITGMAYQQEPDSIAWCVRADGALLGLTLDREQDVKGWHPHRIGGYADVAKTQYAVVESVTVIPSPALDRDELWMIVRRTVNGATKRYVEWQEYYHEEGDDPEDAFYVDSGLTLNNTKNAVLTPGVGATVKGAAGVNFNAVAMFVIGDIGRKIHYRYSTVSITGKVLWNKGVAEITGFVNADNVTCTIRSVWPNLTPIAANGWRMTVMTITGLGHLIGETVRVWADGANQPDKVVTAGGTIPLQDAASKAHVGLGANAVLQPMPVEAGASDGTARGKKQRISRCGIMFHDSIGVLYGRDEDVEATALDRIETRGGSDNMDEPPPLFSGVETVDWPDGYDDQLGALITIIADQAGPATICALLPQVTTMDDR